MTVISPRHYRWISFFDCIVRQPNRQTSRVTPLEMWKGIHDRCLNNPEQVLEPRFESYVTEGQRYPTY